MHSGNFLKFRLLPVADVLTRVIITSVCVYRAPTSVQIIPPGLLYLVRGVLLPLLFMAPGPKAGSRVCDVLSNCPLSDYDAVSKAFARDLDTDL